MNVLQKFICAVLVFVAYCKLGYYRPWEILKAIRAFFTEEKRLKANVLSVNRFGVPIGTIMCSKDCGWLPVDKVFPSEMLELRKLYGNRIGYFGKFAIIPPLQGRLVGSTLLRLAVTKWAFDHDVDIIFLMVNPKHVGMYESRGAKVVNQCAGQEDLEKAPIVFMYIDLNKSAQANKARTEYLLKQNQPTSQKVAA